MPLFDFRCRECGRQFETLVMGSRTPECPSCHSKDLDKLFSTFAARTGGSRTGAAAAPRFT
jgi:putative FmdB family regulatory protein